MDMPVEIRPQADVAAAQANVNRLEGQLRELNSLDAEVRVTADTGPAEKNMDGFKGRAAAVGVSTGLALSAALSQAIDIQDASANLSAQMGLTANDGAKYGKLAGDIYSQNFGQSIDQVNSSFISIKDNFGGLGQFTEDTLTDMSTAALGLSQTFNIDVNDAIRAASQLVKTGLASDATQAFDIITTGFQNGANASGDFLDTLNEYSVQFQKLGIDGPTATGLISQGLKAGARDADLVADAIKEFSIRAVDGSQTTADGFKLIGLNADDMTKRIAAGGPVARAAFQQVLEALAKIPDPATRAQAAVALFGTQAEDLGAALFALNPNNAVEGMDNLDGATQRLNATLGDTVSSKIEGAKRGFQSFLGSLVSLDGPIGDVASGVAGLGPEVLTAAAAMAQLGILAGPQVLVAAKALGGLVIAGAQAAAAAIASAATTIASWVAAAAAAVVQAAIIAAAWLAANPIALIAIAVAAIVALIIANWDSIVAFLTTVWDWIKNTAIAVWTAIVAFLTTIWTAVTAAWMVVWNGIVAFITPIWEVIKTIILTAWDIILNVFRYGAAILLAIFFTIWNPIQALITTIWTAIVAFLTTVWNGIVAIATVVWTAISTVITTVVQAISDFIMPIWQAIVDFLTAVWTNVSAAAAAIWGAITDGITAANNAIFGVISSIWNAIWGFLEPIWNVISSTASAVWDAVSSVISSVMSTIQSVITSVWSGISSFFSGIWGTITGVFSSAGSNIMGALNNLWNTIRNLAGTALNLLVDAGRNIVQGLWNGIVSLGGWLWDQIMGWIRSVVPGPILQFLGIASPSKWMRDKVGKFIPEGLAVGITGASKAAEDAASLMAEKVGQAALAGSNLNSYAATTQAALAPTVGAATTAAVVSAAQPVAKTFQLGSLSLTVTGNLDPTNPVQWRSAIEEIRSQILDVEKSYA
jgi:phage-related protein